MLVQIEQENIFRLASLVRLTQILIDAGRRIDTRGDRGGQGLQEEGEPLEGKRLRRPVDDELLDEEEIGSDARRIFPQVWLLRHGHSTGKALWNRGALNRLLIALVTNFSLII